MHNTPGSGYKICSRCRRKLPIAQFYGDPLVWKTISGRCKECMREVNRQRQQGSYRATANAKAREYSARNLEKRNTLVHNYQARKRVNGGSHTTDQWLGIKLIQEFKCLHCGLSEPEIKLTRDHIIPVSKGGTNDITNIQGLCLSCNSRKGAKLS